MIEETRRPYFQTLWAMVEEACAAGQLRPGIENVFRAFALPLSQVKVVILGQDPYAAPGQAIGRAFAVCEGQRQPRSLRNIFKEVESCCGRAPSRPTLEGWQRQGVLLLNVCLTVREGSIGSHRKFGWETFTDRALQILDERPGKIVFLLWGNDARKKAALISQHPKLEAAHPSPLSASRGFLGCGHFRRANDLLQEVGEKPIDWVLS